MRTLFKLGPILVTKTSYTCSHITDYSLWIGSIQLGLSKPNRGFPGVWVAMERS